MRGSIIEVSYGTSRLSKPHCAQARAASVANPFPRHRGAAPVKLGLSELREALQPCSAEEPACDAVNDRAASVPVSGPVFSHEREPVDQFTATERTEDPLDLGSRYGGG